MTDSLNCFDCKTWCDRDQLVHYENEGLYRCFECAYTHEWKRNSEALALLTEAKQVLEPFAVRGKICNTGWMKDVPDDTKSMIASKYGEYRKAADFLKKLEDSPA